MTVSLVVTLIGADRPGLVARLAERADACGASWQESRMARLAGQFAGIVQLDVPADALAQLEDSLQELQREGLRLTIERGAAVAGAAELRVISLDLIGQDRNGIVRDISAVLARHQVSIDELDTEVESASMSGELLFRASARLILPDGVEIEALRDDLEALANELMVDLSLDPAGNRA